jgi:dephospho-CoA kinase
MKEVAKRHGEVTREKLLETANSLRKEHSPSYVIESLFEEAQEFVRTRGKHCILESVRSPGEVDYLKSESKKHKHSRFFLVAIDADQKVRYARVKARKSETDHISFETFASEEAREMKGKEAHEANIAECVRRADYAVMNNGSIAELHEGIETMLISIQKSL